MNVVWVSKYALTKGVYESGFTSTKICDMIRVMTNGFSDCLLSKDWHKTRDLAIARANEMKATRIESLKKQLAKVEKLEFN